MNIKAMREILKITQKKLAKHMKVEPITVYRWENKKNQPSKVHLDELDVLKSVAQYVHDTRKKALNVCGTCKDVKPYRFLRVSVTKSKLVCEKCALGEKK